MNVLETRFAGKAASLDKITSFVNRQLGITPLARVEVRYSSQSAAPLSASQVKVAIAKLLRDNGMPTAAVSVRAHDCPLDDASGEHVLRLYPSDKREATPAPRTGLIGWLVSRVKLIFGKAPPDAEAGQIRTEPTGRVSNQQAVALLRAAVDQSMAYLTTPTGTGIVASAGTMVFRAKLIVRLASVHEVMANLVSKDLVKAARSIGSMLRDKGLQTAPGFCVSYEYKPRVAGDGTGYASESDVEVVLTGMSHSSGSEFAEVDTEDLGNINSAYVMHCAKPKPQSDRLESTLETASAFVSASTTANANTSATASAKAQRSQTGTALPFRHTASVIHRPAATAQIVGTWEGGALVPFSKPFEVELLELPATFDRSVLQASALAKTFPHLLSVASNSCPLTVDRDSSGALALECGIRRTHDGSTLPMYFVGSKRLPLVGRQLYASGSVQVLVNDPAGVQDPATGTVLPALVMLFQLET
jgi:hypothetical protein